MLCYSLKCELDSKLSARSPSTSSAKTNLVSSTSDGVNAAFSLPRCNVMAAHPAAKAINTQEISNKAQRDLLQLLETVSMEHPHIS